MKRRFATNLHRLSMRQVQVARDGDYRQIQTERRDRDIAALHRPQIGAGLGLLDRHQPPELRPAKVSVPTV